jgi:chemotaxis protein CheX
MDVQYINPFLEASSAVLKQFGIEFKPGKLQLKGSPQLMGRVSVIIGVTGKLRGQVLFNMDQDVAFKIASIMMGGMSITDFDEISKSAIAELFNMVLGNTATIFYNKGLEIDITPPSLLFGENMVMSASKGWIICIPLELSVGGSMSIDLAINDD